MKRYNTQLTSRKRKCAKIINKKENSQHIILPSNGDLYFSILPQELLQLTMLFFPITKILKILTTLHKIPPFSRLINNKNFWKVLWIRDVSSFIPLSDLYDGSYLDFFNNLFFKELSKLTNIDGKIAYLVIRGYDILLYPLLQSNQHYNNAMEFATSAGHIKIVQTLLTKYPKTDYNKIMSEAAMSGHIEIVKLMLENGVNNYNRALTSAAYGGHIEIVKLMLEQGGNKYGKTMELAAIYGHIEIVKLMLEKGAQNYEETLLEAAINDYIEIVKLMLEKISYNPERLLVCYNEIISEVADDRHIEIVKLMLEKSTDIHKKYPNLHKDSINIYNDILIDACYSYQIETVQLMLENGANYEKAIKAAKKVGNLNMIKLIKSYMKK